MARKADVARGTWKSGARDVPNGKPECTCIGTFEHPSRETNSGNLDIPTVVVPLGRFTLTGCG